MHIIILIVWHENFHWGWNYNFWHVIYNEYAHLFHSSWTHQNVCKAKYNPRMSFLAPNEKIALNLTLWSFSLDNIPIWQNLSHIDILHQNCSIMITHNIVQCILNKRGLCSNWLQHNESHFWEAKLHYQNIHTFGKKK